MRDITAHLLAGDLDPSAHLGAGGGAAAYFADRSEAYQRGLEGPARYRRSLNPYRVLARRQLAYRERKRAAGLSNTAYLAASSGTQNLTVTVSPARVKFTVSDPLADLASSAPGAVGGRRGVIREFSDGARDRLADRAAELQALGHVPQVMVTLTAPANWEEIYLHDENGEVLEGGRIFKNHLHAFRKQLDRNLQKMGVHQWSALWFLEFQARGAPHIHLILFGCVLSSNKRSALRGWVGRAWAGIVGNPSRHEARKHARAGTQVARMRKKHFGYAMKYASKMQQKAVPDEFHGVGRFWGVWNCARPAPVVLELEYSRLSGDEAAFVAHLVASVLRTIEPYSPQFAVSRTRKVENALLHGIKHKFGFSVYGSSASGTALGLFS